MKRTGLLYDERFLKHRTGANHPELPERLTAIYNGIRDRGLLEHLQVIPAQAAPRMWIETVHDRDYVDRFEAACRNGQESFESPDNQMCADTYDVALLAVGGILEIADRIVNGELDNAFCAVRPPGHHAEKAKAMGFCYFNNVAVAASYLQTQWLIERVAIIDFDVHHGNGTQAIFEDDPTVFYYSIHEHPSFAYPGTGRAFDNGVQRGTGYTRNTTVLPGQGDDFYREAVENELRPAISHFRPQVIILSTGFDAHVDDDMADISLSTAGYAWMMDEIMKLGDQVADGKLISVLEGGYCLERLPELAADHVQALLQM